MSLMELPLINSSELIARFKEPGLIAIGFGFAAFFAFVSLVRRTVLLILRRTRGISVISAPTMFSDDWSDIESELGSESDSEASCSSSEDENEKETSNKESFSSAIFRDYQGYSGNFDGWWSDAVVKSWEGLNLLCSSSDQSEIIDYQDCDDTGTGEMQVVQFWGEGSAQPARPRMRRRRSFVMMDL